MTLTAKAGDWIGIVGDNGTGKSTFAAGLAGLAPYTSGVMHIGSHAVRPRSLFDRYRHGIFYVGQQPSFPVNLPFSMKTQIFFAHRKAVANERAIESLLESFRAAHGLGDSKELDAIPPVVEELLLSVSCAPSVLIIDEVANSYKSDGSHPHLYEWIKRVLPDTVVFVIDHDRATLSNVAELLIYFGDPALYEREHNHMPEVLSIPEDGARVIQIASQSEASVVDYIEGGSVLSLSPDTAVGDVLTLAVRSSPNLKFGTASTVIKYVASQFDFLAGDGPGLLNDGKRVRELSGGQRVVLTAIVQWLVENIDPPKAVMGHLSHTTIEKLDRTHDFIKSKWKS